MEAPDINPDNKSMFATGLKYWIQLNL